MSFAINAPASAGPAFDIVIDGAGGLLVFDMPSVPLGTLLLAFIVRDAVVSPANAGWSKLIDGLGASNLFLDVFAHEVDATDADLEAGDVRELPFASIAAQEIQGYLLAYDGSGINVVVEASATGSFTADTTPPAPASTTQQAINTIVRVWSSSGSIDFTVPSGFTPLDEYTSNVVAQRSILIASKKANATGAIAADDATASPAATGRAWTVVIRNYPPITPVELFDPVPGHIGLI